MPRAPRPVIHPTLLNAPADSRWANLGWWTPATTTYPDAARALAHEVGVAAGLRPGDVVVDVACGHGDSLAHWVHAFGAARVVGVEPDPALGAAVRARVAAWGLADRITVVTATAEAFDLTREAPEATAVVCVDAAYHFRTRAAWLHRLAADAAPGTRLGFTDLALLAPQPSASLRRMAGWADIPTENLWPIGAIIPTLEAVGFEAVQVLGAGTTVLDGFRTFARRARRRWLLRPHRGGWQALATAAMLSRLRPSLTMVRVGARVGLASVAGRGAARPGQRTTGWG